MPIRRMGSVGTSAKAGRVWMVLGFVAFVILGVHDVSMQMKCNREHERIQTLSSDLEEGLNRCGSKLHSQTVKTTLCENERVEDKQQSEASLRQKNEKINALTAQLSESRQHAQDFESKLQESKNSASVAKLECDKALDSSREAFETEQQQSQEFHAQILELQEKHAKLQETYQALQDDFDDLQEKNNLKQAMYDEAHDALQQLQTENQQLQVQVETLRAERNVRKPEGSKQETKAPAIPLGNEHVQHQNQLINESNDNAQLNKESDFENEQFQQAKQEDQFHIDSQVLQALAQNRRQPNFPAPPNQDEHGDGNEQIHREISALNDVAHAAQQLQERRDIERKLKEENGSQKQPDGSNIRGELLINEEVTNIDTFKDKNGDAYDDQFNAQAFHAGLDNADAYIEHQQQGDAYADNKKTEYSQIIPKADDAVVFPEDGAAAVVAPHPEIAARDPKNEELQSHQWENQKEELQRHSTRFPVDQFGHALNQDEENHHKPVHHFQVETPVANEEGDHLQMQQKEDAENENVHEL